jgi:uncharacterized protein YjbI with pentapeptide repeats
VWIIRGLIVLGLLLAIGAPYHKGLWDWLDLLIVPAVIGFGVVWLGERQQRARDQTAQEDRQRRQREMEEQRYRELLVEDQRAQHEALQAYLDKMSELLIDKGLHEKADRYDPMRVTARARTLALLEQLDREDDEEAGERKRTVLLFLREARLINRVRIADRRGCVIYHAHYVGLRDANLRKAKLRGHRLISTLGKEPVSLEGAIFEGADFSGANLERANLRHTNLLDAKLVRAKLVGANLVRANLEGANLEEANLKDANLRQVSFLRTSLVKADLRGAKLRGAKNLTKRQLAEACGDGTTELPEAWEYPPTWK